MTAPARTRRDAASTMALFVATGAFLVAALGLVAASLHSSGSVTSGPTGPITVGLSEFAITPKATGH